MNGKQKKRIKKTRLADSPVETEYSDIEFVECDFSGADLRNVVFIDCEFTRCNFSNVQFAGAKLQHCTFTKSKIIGVDFFRVDKKMCAISFVECAVSLCSFSELLLKKTRFVGSDFREVTFTEMDLSQADFSGSTFAECIFHNCDLTKANFTDAVGYTIHPANNTITGARFTLPAAMGLLDGYDITIE